MRNIPKSMAKLLSVAFAAMLFSACSKGGDTEPGTNASRKIMFKAEASAGSALHMVVYGYDTDLTTISSLGGTTWTSPEITTPAGATVASITVNARGANPASTLKVQVYVDGILKKETGSMGTALSATAQYNLQ